MDLHTVPIEHPSLIRQFRHHLILIASMLLLTILLSVLVNIYTSTNESNITIQTTTLHDDVNRILSSMIDQETGLRGYSITANSIFLEPFNQGRSQYLSTIPVLNTLLHNDAFHNVSLPFSDLKSRADIWYTTFALPQLRLIRIGNLTSRSEPTFKHGKVLFDQFRISLSHLQQHIDSDMMTISDQQRIINWGVLVGAILLSLLALVLLWSTFTTFQRDLTTQLAVLKNAAKQFSAGDYQVHIHSLKHEELELVGQTLNRLIETVQQQQTALEEHTHEVERVNGEFRALFNAVNIAIMFVSLKGRILTVNHSFTEFFHFPAESIVGLSIDELQALWRPFFSEPPPTWTSQNLDNPEKAEGFIVSLSQIVPTKRELELQLLPVYSTTSAYIGTLYLLRDVTQEYELDQMKRDFVAQVSHELRTPLTSIKGFVDLLLEDPDRLNEEQEEFLQIVQENARRLAMLVNDLLDLSRIESGKMQLECTTVALNPLIEDILASFTLQISKMHQKLEVQLIEPSPVVFADAMRVQQIVNNLVSNAHKYTLEGGILRISTQVEEQKVWVIVQDSGIGMTPEEQARLFNRFFRAKNHLTENIGGTGLGLVITRSLVELHGGTIQVDSQPGQGSTFRFTLPLASEKVPETIRPATGLSFHSPEKKRLLVVEDDRDNASLLQHICERHGYEVTVAYSGQEALELAEQQHPNLITLDLLLPDINGFEVLEQLKRSPQLADIPVIFISMLDHHGRGYFLGAIDYLPKPFNIQALLAHIHNLLGEVSSSILIAVDDHNQEYTQMEGHIQKKGYKLITTSNTTQMLFQVRQHHPLLILLDSQLPPDGGLSALQALRTAPEAEVRETPVLVLGTEDGALNTQWQATERSGNTHIVKQPDHLEEIVEAITQFLAVGVRR